jgi:hypothetical protein
MALEGCWCRKRDTRSDKILNKARYSILHRLLNQKCQHRRRKQARRKANPVKRPWREGNLTTDAGQPNLGGGPTEFMNVGQLNLGGRPTEP